MVQHPTAPSSTHHRFLSALSHKSQYTTILKLTGGRKSSSDSEKANNATTRHVFHCEISHHKCSPTLCHVGQVAPIDMLPDDVLLAIFDFCVSMLGLQARKKDLEAWQSLVHVCIRWRCVVFGSPCRLDLGLVCIPETTRERLDVWPPLPLIVEGVISSKSVDNIVFALGHSDRVCRINLRINRRSKWDKVLAAMQVPFPALTDLLLQSEGDLASHIPDNFLGGFAPRLQYLNIDRILFPGIPNLLLSATHLVDLDLSYVPHSGYILPEAMATCLSALTSLDTFSLGFVSFQSRPDRESRHPPLITRSVLPDLTTICFQGAGEYLDDLVARIDAPRLCHLSITFLHQRNFDTPHLVQLISRTPMLRELNEAHVNLNLTSELLFQWASAHLHVQITCSCEESVQKLSSIAQAYAMCLPPLPTMENLRLGVYPDDLFSKWGRKVEVENYVLLGLLRPFITVKNLYLSKEFLPSMASILQELVGSRTMEVLPSL